MTIKIGDKVRIKPEAWKEAFNNEYYPNEVTIIALGPYSDNYRYLSEFPLRWWREEDLIPMSKVEYEPVTSIRANNHTMKIGYKFRCRCEYEIVKLYPVWDSETGKHLSEHSANSFRANMIYSTYCPIHAGLAKRK